LQGLTGFLSLRKPHPFFFRIRSSIASDLDRLPGDDTLHLWRLGLELLEVEPRRLRPFPAVFSFPKPDVVGVNAVAAGEFLWAKTPGIVSRTTSTICASVNCSCAWGGSP